MATTSFDLVQLGLVLQKAGTALNNRIEKEFSSLSFHEVQELSNKAQELFIKSKLLFAQGVIQLSEEKKSNLVALKEASKQIAGAIQKIEKIQKVINLTTKLLGLAGNILNGNLGTIISSVNGIINEVKPQEPA
jgi:hypothetical protein